MDAESTCSNEKLFQKLSSLQKESHILSKLSPTKDNVYYANSPGDLEDILCDVGEDDVYTMVLAFCIGEDPVLDKMERYLENSDEMETDGIETLEKEWFENKETRGTALRNARKFFLYADGSGDNKKVKFVVNTTCKDARIEEGVFIQIYDPMTELVNNDMKLTDKQEKPTVLRVTSQTIAVKLEPAVKDIGLETSFDLTVEDVDCSEEIIHKVRKM